MNFNIISTKKFNLYLIHILKYLQYFRFNVYYKFEKNNIVSNVLFKFINRKYRSKFNNIKKSLNVF